MTSQGWVRVILGAAVLSFGSACSMFDMPDKMDKMGNTTEELRDGTVRLEDLNKNMRELIVSGGAEANRIADLNQIYSPLAPELAEKIRFAGSYVKQLEFQLIAPMELDDHELRSLRYRESLKDFVRVARGRRANDAFPSIIDDPGEEGIANRRMGYRALALVMHEVCHFQDRMEALIDGFEPTSLIDILTEAFDQKAKLASGEQNWETLEEWQQVALDFQDTVNFMFNVRANWMIVLAIDTLSKNVPAEKPDVLAGFLKDPSRSITLYYNHRAWTAAIADSNDGELKFVKEKLNQALEARAFVTNPSYGMRLEWDPNIRKALSQMSLPAKKPVTESTPPRERLVQIIVDQVGKLKL